MVNTEFSTYIKPGLLDTLPIDLKREILETTAYRHPAFALHLAIVSRDVQSWAERIIYRELYFSGQRVYRDDTYGKPTPLQKFKVALEARPPSFFAEYVRALHFDGICNVEDILPIIQVCTGVRNFGLYTCLEGPSALEIMRIVHSLPLHTLFISIKNLTGLLMLHAPAPSDNEVAATSEETSAAATAGSHALRASADALSEIPDTEAPLAPLTESSLHCLKRLGLVDGFEYPAERFPALTHLALVPDFEDKVLQHVKTSLENSYIESIVVMLHFINAPRRTKTLRALQDIADPRLVLFTLPVSLSRYIEDDLWDLANEFPDEEEPLRYLGDILGERILSFEELMELEIETRPKEEKEEEKDPVELTPEVL